MKTLSALCIVAVASVTSHAQLKWYKFDKRFIETHYSYDGGAIGPVEEGAR